ncbi:MAG TPA: hypothetical protein VN180_00825, partial [Acidimicrobiia bacterium]|nr:hypothetical protein [Acidimicrobiia bacterium]
MLLGAIGIVLTASVSWTARDTDRSNEHRLLVVQTRQAAGAIGAAILGIANPLTTAQQIATATGGDPQEFARFMSAYAGPARLFVTASLWRTDGAAPRP